MLKVRINKGPIGIMIIKSMMLVNCTAARVYNNFFSEFTLKFILQKQPRPKKRI